MIKDYRFIVLKRPYDLYEKNQDVRDVLETLFKLKLDGYKAHYPVGIMPIGNYDFFADHVMLCKIDGLRLKPLSSWRTISNTTCRKYNIDFPFLDANIHNQFDEYPDHVEAVNKLTNEYNQKNLEYYYQGGWTIDTDLKGDEKKMVINASYAMMFLYYQTQNFPGLFMSANVKYGVENRAFNMGFKPLSKEGKDLKAVVSNQFYGDLMAMLHIKEWTDEIREKADPFQYLWENRIEIEEEVTEENVNLAA